jgi:hypothetical protein
MNPVIETALTITVVFGCGAVIAILTAIIGAAVRSMFSTRKRPQDKHILGGSDE